MTQTKRYFGLLMPCVLNGLRVLQLWVWIRFLKLWGKCFLEPQWQHFLHCSHAITLVVLCLWPFTAADPNSVLVVVVKGRNYHWSLLPSPLDLVAPGLHSGSQYMHAESLTMWGPPGTSSPPACWQSLSFFSHSSPLLFPFLPEVIHH